jgi:protoporphyrinogen oxidase
VAVETDGEVMEADVVLSTLPTTTLARILAPAPPPDVMDALGRQRVRAMLLVYLVLDRDRYTEFDAHYIADGASLVARLSEPKNYRDGPDPAGRTVLCAEIACWPDDDIVRQPPDAVGAMVGADLERLGLPPVNPVAVETRLLPSVYPVFDVAGRADRAVIDRWLAAMGGDGQQLLSLGRQGLGVIDNLHHVLAMGSAAASVIGADGDIDHRAWRGHLDRFGQHTVED